MQNLQYKGINNTKKKYIQQRTENSLKKLNAAAKTKCNILENFHPVICHMN